MPFVADEAPIYRRGKSRPGPTFKETILVHSVARILFNGSINNIQGSWVKMGLPGLKYLLSSGINDIGGVLMNESITRSAGASFGQELNLDDVISIADELNLNLKQRNTLYEPLSNNLQDLINLQSIPLIPIIKASGGIASTWRNKSANKAGNVLISANKSIHKKMLRLLKPALK